MTLFRYRPGRSALHRSDPVLKLAIILLLTISIVRAGAIGCGVIGAFILAGYVAAGRLRAAADARELLRELYRFRLLFLVVLLSVSALEAGKLALLVTAGNLLVATTSTGSLRHGLERILSPVPLLRAKRIGLMCGLMLSFLPLLLERSAELDDAARARCLDGRRRPLRRIRYLVVPLVVRTATLAGEVTEALEARCLTESPTPPRPGEVRAALPFLAAAAALTLAVFLGPLQR